MFKDLLATAKTKTGLRVITAIIEKQYEIGRQVAKDFKETKRIRFDDFLPQWTCAAATLTRWILFNFRSSALQSLEKIL